MHVRTYSSASTSDHTSDSTATVQSSSKSHRKNSANKVFFSLLGTFIAVIFGSFMWVALTSFSTTTDNRNQAAANPSTILRYNQNALTVTVGQEFTVPIELVTGTKSIAVAEVLPTFDPAYFRAISLQNGTFLTTQLVAGGITSGGTGFTPLLVAKPVAIPASGMTGQGTLALVRFRALQAGTSSLSFDQTRSRAPEFNGAAENIIGTYQAKSVIIQAPVIPPNTGIRQCTNMTAITGAITINQPMSASCTFNTASPATVQFRVAKNGAVVAGSAKSATIQAGAAVSSTFDFTPTTVGAHVAQCRICKAGSTTDCSPWGFATPSFDQVNCGWCAGSCLSPVPEVCAASEPQTAGNACVVTNNTCVDQPFASSCQQTFTATAPTVNPNVNNASLRLEFKQQGVRRANISIPATITLAYVPSAGAAKVTKEYSQVFVSNAIGLLASTTVLPLTGITAPSPLSNVEVYVKTPTTLQKKLGVIVVRSNTTTDLRTTTELFVGDFNQTTGQANVFNILDISKMLTEYRALDNPITNANRAFDVNFDNNFNILDSSLVLSNYNTLHLEGQAP